MIFSLTIQGGSISLLGDALQRAINVFEKNHYEHKFLIVISDGQCSSTNLPTFQKVQKYLASSDITVISVVDATRDDPRWVAHREAMLSLASPTDKLPMANDLLEEFLIQKDRFAFTVSTKKELEDAFEKLMILIQQR